MRKFEFEILSDNLGQTQANVQDAKRPVTSARETAQDAEDILGVFEDIADRANEIEDTLHGLAKSTKLLKKVAALRTVADKLEDVLNNIAARVDDFEDSARRLHERVKPAEQKVEDGRKKLEDFEGKFDEVDGEIGELRVGVDDVAEKIEIIASLDGTFGVIDDTPSKAALTLDAKAAIPNQAVEAINQLYADTRAKADALLMEIDDRTGIVSTILDIQNTLQTIADDLAFLREPLAVLNTALRPVEWALDAADAVFDAVVKPVLDPLLDSLGINALVDRVTDRLAGLFPSVSLIDDAEEFLDRVVPAIDIDLPDSFIGQLDFSFLDFTGSIDVDLLDPFDLTTEEGGPSAGDDVLIADPDVPGPIFAGAGDDVLVGGEGEDQLFGEAGDDVLVGGGGDDFLDGGVGENDAAIYGDALANFYIERPDENASNVVIIHNSPRDPERDEGQDDLVNIETFAFDDVQVSLHELNNFFYAAVDGVPLVEQEGFLLFGTTGRDFLFGDASNDRIFGYSEAAGPGVDGDDYIVGGEGMDELFGGAGNDLLDGGLGFDTLDGGAGIDTASYISTAIGATVVLDPSLPTTFASLSRLQSPSDELIDIENVRGSEAIDEIFGDGRANLIDGEGGNDWLHGFGGNDEISGGDGRDRIAGGRGDDLLSGGDDGDTFGAGAGDDVYDGGDGDDEIFYSLTNVIGELRDHPSETQDGVIHRVEVDFRSREVAKFNSGGGSLGVDVFTDIELLSATHNADLIIVDGLEDGQKVLLNGFDGDDVFWGPSGIIEYDNLVALFGDGGDDVFHLRGAVTTDAGAGDDLVYAGPYGGYVHGKDGDDTIDFSGSDADSPDAAPADDNALSPHGWSLTIDAVGEGTARGFNLFEGQTTGVETLETQVIAEGEPTPSALTFIGFETIIGSGFDDEIENDYDDGSITIFGGGGDDTLRAATKGDAEGGYLDNGDQLYGGDGDDTLIAGTAGNQGLFGGDGDDVLDARAGGAIQYGSGFTQRRERPDVELHGENGDDRFVIGRSKQTIDGGDGLDTADYYSNSSERQQNVFVDLALNREFDIVNGVEVVTDESDVFISIENVWGGSSFDRIYGDDGANVILGHGGGDYIDGRGGDDVIYGHDGQDEIFGGDGDDFIHAGDTVEGNDATAGGLGSRVLDDIDGGDGVDTVSYAAYTLHGDARQRLTEDNLTPINADLALEEDTVFYLLFDFVDNGFRLEGDNIKNVENLIGSIGSDTIYGNEVANTLNGDSGDDFIDGRDGDDALLGGDGDDELLGGAGDDIIFSGAGTDIIDGGDGQDTLDYSGADRGIVYDVDAKTVTETNTVDLPVWSDNENPDDPDAVASRLWTQNPSDNPKPITPREIYEADPLFANDPSDLQRLSSGGKPNGYDSEVNGDGSQTGRGLEISVLEVEETTVDVFSNIETVVGSQGDDLVIRGAAAVVFDGAGGVDTIDYSSATSALAFKFGRVDEDGAAAGDQLSNVERLIATNLSDRVDGDASANQVDGRGGDDLLRGGDGDDDLDGGAGVDIVRGGAGDDVLATGGGGTLEDSNIASGDRGADEVNGGSSSDIVRGGADNDVVKAGGGDDVASGDGGDDTVDGGGGDDVVRGGAGDDMITGGAGEDRVIGDRGNDVVRGGAGDDVVRGGAGDDVVVGQAGDDILWGGGGADRFVFGVEDGRDIVRDFQNGVDLLNLSARSVSFDDLEIQSVVNGTLVVEGDLSILVRDVLSSALTEDDFIF